MFILHKKDQKTKARRGEVQTGHGVIQSPFFMPVGTNGTVKSLDFEDLNNLTAQLLLSNTYHLYLRPGLDIIEEAGGLHSFVGWDKPILTDSGGYQVFSLTTLRKLRPEGVEFQSHLDGSTHFFTPQKVMDIEMILGSDMIMPLDVCAPYPCAREEAEQSVRWTREWAQKSRSYFNEKKGAEQQALFGIIQGATYQDLRQRSTEDILNIGFDGYAIGGVSVGEPVKDMFLALDWVLPNLPEDRPRYFMGIGYPDQIVKAVGEGIDMFDTCVPTRFGRHGSAFTHRGKVTVRNGEFSSDSRPIDEDCACIVCQRYSRRYIRHLLNLKEITGLKLVSYHNVYFYVNLMQQIRKAIDEDCYEEFQNNFLQTYGSDLYDMAL
ncbi:MAG: tRNA guanosine(34) transglycosylase Tgt [Candidatus Omnitrophica bacterium]|nr:tRNA guanosine(34) transglycosylase Tgt [Candidatus Omnitrophota bacterium]